MSGASKEKDPFIASLGKIYAGYTGGFAAFVVLIAILEQMGVPDRILGYLLCLYRHYQPHPGRC